MITPPPPAWVRTGTMLAAAVLVGAATPATAQVFDIGENGAVTRLDQPAFVHAPPRHAAARLQGLSPLVAAPAAEQAAASPVLVTIAEAARANQLHPALLEAVAWQESRLHQSAVSPKGAVGVMQLMPATAASMAVNPHDPQGNIHGGARQLRGLLARYNGDLVRTLAAYNAGTGAVDKYGGIPPYPETRAYVAAVLERLASRAIMAQP